MGIAIVFGFIFIILIVLIFVLISDSGSSESANDKNKLPPITSGRNYPWFYIKDCSFYFPVSTKDIGTKEELLEELTMLQKSSNYDRVIEKCDQIIALDYKFSRIWLDKINALFDSVLAGKEWTASISKNIANCCYNYTRTFSNSYDKSVNAKHLLISTILKRSKEVIAYNHEKASETYNFELYNLLINLYHMFPFSELLDLASSSLENGKNLEEIKKNSYGSDVIRSFIRYISLAKQKRSIILDKETTQELKVTGKTIINDEEFSNSWIGFNILFPEGMSKVELVFKFFDQRRQEIDLSDGSNKRIREFYKNEELDRCYDLVVLGEERIKYVTIALYEESNKKELNDATFEKEQDKTEKIIEKQETEENNKPKTPEEIRMKKIEEAQAKIEAAINGTDIVQDEEKVNIESEEKEDEDSTSDETKEVEKTINEDEDYKGLEYKIYPTFAGIKQIGMSENYCLLLREDGKVEKFGRLEKNINVSEWEKIEKLYVTNTTAFGIRKNGTITVAGKSMYDNWEYQYTWEHIVKLEPSYNHIVGLKEDGTVVAIGDNTYGQCKVEEWGDIVDISASFHTVVLTKEGKVIGVINEKKVFDVLADEEIHEENKLQEILREPVFISYRRLLPYALEKIQRSAEHLLIVVDNLKEKNFLGIITLEDILEELVGEIYDEHDAIPKDILEIGHHIFQVSGSYDLEELFDEYLEDTTAPKGKLKSVGSWIKSLFLDQEIEEESEIQYENLDIKVLEYDEEKKIILKVEIIENTNYEEEE